MTETAVLFGPRQALVGVLTDPAAPAPATRPAVILLNAGRIHHVGPNRLHVKLARRLAELGYVVLRFDFSGLGDSEVRDDHLPYAQTVIAETDEAIRLVGAARGAGQCVLIGICSGAAVAALTARDDPRVTGLVLINVRAQVDDRWTTLRAYSLKFLRHYWKLLLFRPRAAVKRSRWRSEPNGGSAAETTARSATRLDHPRPSPGPDGRPVVQPAGATQRSQDDRLLADLVARGTRVLMVFSEADSGLDFVRVRLGRELARLRATGSFELAVIPRSDHVFTRLESQAQLVDVVVSWMARLSVELRRGAPSSPKIGGD